MDAAGILKTVNDFVWGPFMLVLMVGTGIFLTVRLRFLPWRNLGYAIRQVFVRQSGKEGQGDITPFQSLMTALAATIGTGNIIGVATAMVLGGPGALVWMWISALFGLSTKYAESVLAVRYRIRTGNGEMAGGPMYTMRYGIRNRWAGRSLAFFFSLMVIGASFGIGNMTQGNSISEALHNTFSVPVKVTGMVLAVLALAVLAGGIRSIGKVCSALVPAMAMVYLAAALIVILVNWRNIPAGLGQIFGLAFSVKAAGGGISGSVMANAMRWGIARGVFSNEAGLGSAPIAAAAAQTDEPSRQGYINMTGTFFVTIIVCSMTGLAIASSGVLGKLNPETGEMLTGSALTIQAFQGALGGMGGYLLTAGIVLFAFSTIVGWEYYGEKALEYLTGSTRLNMVYRIVYSMMVYVGATVKLQVVWDFSDTMNGLMAVPNLISLLILSNVVAKECFAYQKQIRKG